MSAEFMRIVPAAGNVWVPQWNCIPLKSKNFITGRLMIICQ